MGEYAEMFLDGTLCESCGALIQDDSADFGVPRKCADCKREHRRNKAKKKSRHLKGTSPRPSTPRTEDRP